MVNLPLILILHEHIHVYQVIICSFGCHLSMLINRLGTGWSVHTNKLSTFHRGDQLSMEEQEHIMNVIAKADYLDQVEQERIG